MSDEPGHEERYADWKKRHDADQQTPRESFKQVSSIAQYMSYDLIDKVQFWEKETLKLPDDEIARRLPHLIEFLEQLRSAYLHFTDVEF